jgi:hypothetical protein
MSCKERGVSAAQNLVILHNTKVLHRWSKKGRRNSAEKSLSSSKIGEALLKANVAFIVFFIFY